MKKLSEAPLLKKEVGQYGPKADADIASQAETAYAASVAEFILEGLHVENRLNKNAKGGETVFKR